MTDSPITALDEPAMVMRLRSLLQTLALVAGLAAHLVAPMAAHGAAGEGAGSFVCAPSGGAGGEAQSAIVEMFRLAGAEIPDDDAPDPAPHCEACVISACAAPAALAITKPVAYAQRTRAPARLRESGIYTVRGPPLGLRAPPSSLKTA